MKTLIASLVALPLLAGNASAGTPLNDRQLDSVTAGTIVFTAGIIIVDDIIVVWTDRHDIPQPGLAATVTTTTPFQTIVTEVNTLNVNH